jgi:HD-GYP domain-containing protein (c-di-GMP phosphodiesterase class II)
VADAFDAMTSSRPYRKAMSPAQAIKELKRGSRVQFDPRIIAAFLETPVGKGEPLGPLHENGLI